MNKTEIKSLKTRIKSNKMELEGIPSIGRASENKRKEDCRFKKNKIKKGKCTCFLKKEEKRF